MKHIVQFSGGLASWATAKRVVATHGTDDVVLLFADTLAEDADLYRFIKDASENVGVPITTVVEGRTPWQVCHDESFIANTRVDICSRVLKREPLNQWRNDNCTPDNSVIYIGFDWSEQHRAKDLLRYVIPWNYQFPLFDKPYLTKEGIKQLAISEGLRPSRAYDQGFDHDNCSGRCFKAGHGHYRLLLKVRPEQYAASETEEQLIRNKIGDYAILRDRRGGKTRPLTLKEFRERIEAETGPVDQSEEEFGGCGCATDYDESELVNLELK